MSASIYVLYSACNTDATANYQLPNMVTDVAANLCMFCDKVLFLLHSTAVKARSVTPDRVVVGRVTQTLTIECEAIVNLNDTAVTFTWTMGNGKLKETRNVSTVDGMATDTFKIMELNIADYRGKSLECHPSNAIGEYNFTRFNISVELFPPPEITKFGFQPDSKDAVVCEWLPVNDTGYPGASVGGYYIELARDKDGSVIEARANVTGGNDSYVFSVEECSKEYWVRIKAVSGKQDISSFSVWTRTEAVGCPLIVSPGTCKASVTHALCMHDVTEVASQLSTAYLLHFHCQFSVYEHACGGVSSQYCLTLDLSFTISSGMSLTP